MEDKPEVRQDPISFATMVVDGQHRLRLRKEFFRNTEWITSGSSDCIAILGEHCLELWHSTSVLFDQLNRAREALRNHIHEADSPDSKQVEFARFIAATWHVKLRAEDSGSRYSIVLPAEARDLGIVPASTEIAVVFLYKQLLEIWKIDAWLNQCRPLRRNLHSRVADLIASNESICPPDS